MLWGFTLASSLQESVALTEGDDALQVPMGPCVERGATNTDTLERENRKEKQDTSEQSALFKILSHEKGRLKE